MSSVNHHLYRGLIAVSCLALVACSGHDPEPSPSPSVVVTSLEATPVPSAPTIPAISEQDSPEGALAAAEYYLELTAYAASTGDYSELEAMSGPDCTFCNTFITNARSNSDKGVRGTVPDVTINQHREWEIDDDIGGYRVDLLATKGEYVLSKQDGSTATMDSERFFFAMVLIRSEDGWIVEDAQALAPEHWNQAEDD